MPGDSAADWSSQKENYVQIRRDGKVIGPDQQEVKRTEEFPKPKNNPISHISEKNGCNGQHHWVRVNDKVSRSSS